LDILLTTDLPFAFEDGQRPGVRGSSPVNSAENASESRRWSARSRAFDESESENQISQVVSVLEPFSALPFFGAHLG
jgi:hypothetical protein